MTAAASNPAALSIVTTSGGAAQYTAAGTTNLSTGTWYHVLGTWTAGSAVRIYLNGTLEGTQATATTALRTSTVGSTWGKFQTAYIDADMDELCIWNRVLVQSEIDELYGGGSPTLQAPFMNYITTNGGIITGQRLRPKT